MRLVGRVIKSRLFCMILGVAIAYLGGKFLPKVFKVGTFLQNQFRGLLVGVILGAVVGLVLGFLLGRYFGNFKLPKEEHHRKPKNQQKEFATPVDESELDKELWYGGDIPDYEDINDANQDDFYEAEWQEEEYEDEEEEDPFDDD